MPDYAVIVEVKFSQKSHVPFRDYTGTRMQNRGLYSPLPD
jgi:hypothetical protein